MASVEADGSAAVLAKISDFGLALRAMPLPSGRGWAPVRTPPRGTPLYMAPELFKEKDAQGCVEASGNEKTEGVTECRARCTPLSRSRVHIELDSPCCHKEKEGVFCACSREILLTCSLMYSPLSGLSNVGRVQLRRSAGVLVHGEACTIGAP